MMSMFRCLSCNEMILINAGACRFCGSPFEMATARNAAAQQERITQIVAGANQFKLGQYVAPLFAVAQAFMLFGPILPLKLLFFVSIAPPAAVIGFWVWLRRTRTIETRDPDLASARAAMKRTLYVWLAVFVMQLIALAVFFGRLYLL